MTKLTFKSFIQIIIGLAVTFSVTFLILSVHSTYTLNGNLETITQHPFAVSHAIFRVKGYVSEGTIGANRLVMYRSPQDIQLVEESFAAIRQNMRVDLNTISDKYLGPAEDAKALSEACEKIFASQDTLISLIRSSHNPQVQVYMARELTPSTTSANIAADKMLTFAQNTVARLSKESIDTLRSTLLLALGLTVAFIVLSVLFLRTYALRLKDQEHSAFLLSIFSKNIDDVFMVYDATLDKTEYIFENSHRLLGLPPTFLEDALPMDFDQYFQYDDERNLFAHVSKRLIKEKVEIECIYKNPISSEEKSVLLSIYPIREMQSFWYIISITDLAEVKKNQAVLSDALLAAQTANLAKSNFLSNMSHEIRTPINAIIGMTEIACLRIDDKVRVQNCLEKIKSSSVHLSMLINNVLDMSKIESGKIAILCEIFNIRVLIKELTEIILPQTRAKQQIFKVNIGNLSCDKVAGDTLRLNQILLNLLSNAVKYTPAEGQISLQVEEVMPKNPKFTRIRFTLSDTGIGMSQEFLEKIFVPFEQELRLTSERGNSTGIGMAITKNLIDLIGGTINITSVVDQGSTFVMELPFETVDDTNQPAHVPNEQQTQDELAPEGVYTADQPHEVDFTGKRFLVAEDNEINMEIVRELLEEVHVTVDGAANGKEACDKFASAPQGFYDIILMDIQMPIMDGYQAAVAIRKMEHPDAKRIPIVALTANAFADDVFMAHNAGMDTHISKPLDVDSFYQTLTTCFQQNHKR